MHEHELRAESDRALEELARARHAARDRRHLGGADDLEALRRELRDTARPRAARSRTRRSRLVGHAPSLERRLDAPSTAAYRVSSRRSRLPFPARGVAQPGSALRSGRRGPQFKSGHPDQGGGTNGSPAGSSPAHGDRGSAVTGRRDAGLRRAVAVDVSSARAQGRSVSTSTSRSSGPGRSSARRATADRGAARADARPGAVRGRAARGDRRPAARTPSSSTTRSCGSRSPRRS